MELIKYKNNRLPVDIPKDDDDLSLFESEYERWTLFIV